MNTQSIFTDREVNAMLASAGSKLPPVVIIGELPSGYVSFDMLAQSQIESDLEYRRENFREDLGEYLNEGVWNTLVNNLDMEEISKQYIQGTLKAVACTSIVDNLNNAGFFSVRVSDVPNTTDKLEYSIDMVAFRKELAVWLRYNRERFVDAVKNRHSSYPGFISFRSISPVISLNKFLEDKYDIESLFDIIFKIEGVYSDTQWEFFETDGTNIYIDTMPVVVCTDTEDGTDYITGIVDNSDCVGYCGHSMYSQGWLNTTKPALKGDPAVSEFVRIISRTYNTTIFTGVDSNGETVVLN